MISPTKNPLRLLLVLLMLVHVALLPTCAKNKKSSKISTETSKIVDVTAPTVGAFQDSTGIGLTGFTLVWTAASDGVTAASAIAYYVCSGSSLEAINTVKKCEAATKEMDFTANTLTLAVSGKTEETTCYFNVISKDAAGNKSIYGGKEQATASNLPPTVGAFSASTSVDYTSFTLNWTAASDDFTSAALLEYFVCSGGSAEAIDTVEECEAATSEMAYTANTLTLAISGKSEDTNYYYNIVVKDAGSRKSIYSAKTQSTEADIIVPTAGTFSAVSDLGPAWLTLNWAAGSDNFTPAADLEYLVCSGASAAAINEVAECEGATIIMNYTANTLTRVLTGLTPQTTYFYNVVVRDGAGNKSIYNGQSETTPPDVTAPTVGALTTSAVLPTSLILNWEAGDDLVTPVASLEYYVCSGASVADIDTVAECEAATQVMTWTANTLTKSVTGLAQGSAYHYNVIVRDAEGNKDDYNGIKQLTFDTQWTGIRQSGAPAARFWHSSLWTGSQMLIWGGYDGSSNLNTGGIYNPTTNSWSAISTAGDAPSARRHVASVWTGSRMLIWGGFNGAGLGTGAAYNPSNDTWTVISSTNAPSARFYHTAVWTGSKMIVWGGGSGATVNTGALYDPTNDTWTPMSTTNAPTARIGHTAIWTGSKMIIWGGSYTNTGGSYDPTNDTWTPLSTTNAPAARSGHTAVWTGSRMIVWGGSSAATSFQSGGVYDPANDSWTPTATVGAPAARRNQIASWIGNKMVVFGGINYAGTISYNNGFAYDLASDSWTAVSSTLAPRRYLHTAVTTDSKVFVFGGKSGVGPVNAGAVLNFSYFDNDGDDAYDMSDCSDNNPAVNAGCTNADGDGLTALEECDDSDTGNAIRGRVTCSDFDADNYYYDSDCDDENASGWTNCTDADGDAYYAQTDCDEGNHEIFPGSDLDSDGYFACQDDPNDSDCDDPNYTNCNCDVNVDGDGDGVDECADSNDGDCDDPNPSGDGDGDGYSTCTDPNDNVCTIPDALACP
jgi:N-acetylneuraminic acid mutarotase